MACIGVLLVSSNWAYADRNGSVAWGPKSDKNWLRFFVKNKICACGFRTFASLPKSFIDLPEAIYVGAPTDDCQVNLGGPKFLYTYPPDRLIIHKTYFEVDGPTFTVPSYYRKMVSVPYEDYEEIVYEKQW